MNVRNKPPVYVPPNFQGEIEKLSKAALMDLVWFYAFQMSGANSADATMDEFHARREVIMEDRKSVEPPKPKKKRTPRSGIELHNFGPFANEVPLSPERRQEICDTMKRMFPEVAFE